MPRAKSEDKRNNILAACQKVIVRDGLNATTAVIAREADVATGSLFTYFPTKADLINELYIILKGEMAEAIAAANSAVDASDYTKLHDAWCGWTTWSVEFTEKHQALEILRTSDQLTQASKDYGDKTIMPVFELIARCWVRNSIDYPAAFLYEIIGAVSDATMHAMVRDPKYAARYQEAGFETIWKLIT